jgi:hypothetical protein
MIVDKELLHSWSVPGHTFGQCLALAHPELVYVNVPKNASTWTKAQLATLGAKEDNYFINSDLNKKSMLVVLRDPVERWVSGISWYMSKQHPELINRCEINSEVRSAVLLMVERQIIFDSHTTPQLSFLQGIDFSNTTFMRVKSNNDEYRETFSKFFKKELGIDNLFNRMPPQHITADNLLQYRWTTMFQSALNDGVFANLHKYFDADIELFSTTKFYE